MSLIPIDGNVQFVQSTTPSNPADGDVWVDTSLTPSQTKIYDGGAAAFIQPRELSNLDAPVSGAGATQTDIESGAEDALEEDIANMNPASNSVAANLDGGVAAVDWSSKTANIAAGGSTTNTDTDLVSASGSGYIFHIMFSLEKDEFKHVRVDIDGVTEIDDDISNIASMQSGNTGSRGQFVQIHGPLRFDSSFAVGSGSDAGGGGSLFAGVSYVTD